MEKHSLWFWVEPQPFTTDGKNNLWLQDKTNQHVKKMNRHTHAEITKQSLKRNSVNATSISSLLLPCILNWKLLKSNNYHVNGFHHGRWLDSTKSGTIHCSLKKRKKKEKKMLIQPGRPTLGLTHYLLNSKPKIHFRYIPAKNDYFYKLWMFSVSETTGYCSWKQEVHYIILIWWTNKNGEKTEKDLLCPTVHYLLVDRRAEFAPFLSPQ